MTSGLSLCDPPLWFLQMEKAEHVFLSHIKEEEEVELPKLLAVGGSQTCCSCRKGSACVVCVACGMESVPHATWPRTCLVLVAAMAAGVCNV
jgi:hypothetical protein